MPPPATRASPTPGVRIPQQARAQETFDRVLRIGAELVAAEGFAGLSITEICHRAGVSAGALYARVENKDALALAIHDREFARMAVEHSAFEPSDRWTSMSTDRLILGSVQELGRHYARHSGLLRAFILRSSVDEMMRERGLGTTEDLEHRLCSLWLTRAVDFPHSEPVTAAAAAFRIVLASLSWRVAYGPRLTGPADRGWQQHVEDVAASARAYLCTRPLPAE
jgi:AcrR family transcriptional regulator